MNEIRTTQSSKASSRETRLRESMAQDFLDKGKEEDQECGTCKTASFCNAALARLNKELSRRQIASDRGFLGAHGIETSNKSLCAGNLVRQVMRQVESKDFWVADDDPLVESDSQLQVSDALDNATRSIVERMRNGETL